MQVLDKAAWRELAETVAALGSPEQLGALLNNFGRARKRIMELPPTPRVVCLCGSTRLRRDFELCSKLETAAGRIVLSPGSFTWAEAGISKEVLLGEAAAAALDELHKRKIDLADEVVVIAGIGGYCGSSTTSEVEYSVRTGKRLRLAFPERGIAGEAGKLFSQQLAEQ